MKKMSPSIAKSRFPHRDTMDLLAAVLVFLRSPGQKRGRAVVGNLVGGGAAPMKGERKKKMDAVAALAAKGDGTLIRHASGVWSYPGASTSGTNLAIPTEHVSDDQVRAAVQSGAFVRVANNSVRLRRPEHEAAERPPVQPGTPEAGTELPARSHPERDAGVW